MRIHGGRFVEKCTDSEHRSCFVHVPIGAADERPSASRASFGAPCEPPFTGCKSSGGLGSCRKPVKYCDVARKDLSAPYRLASTLHSIGVCDKESADLGEQFKARAKEIAKAGGKQSGSNDKDAVKACVDEMRGAGWRVSDGEAFTERGTFDPLTNVSWKPTLV